MTSAVLVDLPSVTLVNVLPMPMLVVSSDAVKLLDAVSGAKVRVPVPRNWPATEVLPQKLEALTVMLPDWPLAPTVLVPVEVAKVKPSLEPPLPCVPVIEIGPVVVEIVLLPVLMLPRLTPSLSLLLALVPPEPIRVIWPVVAVIDEPPLTTMP